MIFERPIFINILPIIGAQPTTHFLLPNAILIMDTAVEQRIIALEEQVVCEDAARSVEMSSIGQSRSCLFET